MHVRRFLLVALLVLGGLDAITVDAKAEPTPVPPIGSALSEREALGLAASSGKPVEVTSLTDERTLVMAKPEGYLQASLTAGAVRVSDQRGGWRAPSTTLVRGADGTIRPEAALANIAVSAGGTGPLLSVADGQDASAKISWPTSLPAPDLEGATATYREVYPGVDLVVRAGVESAETFLVVKTRAASLNPSVRSASFGFSAPGLTVKELANGARSLVDARGGERLVIPPARMWDSAGKEQGLTRTTQVVSEGVQARSTEVDVSVTSKVLTAAADHAFLDDPSTVFPVIIDPEVSLTRSYTVRVTEDFDQINDMSVDGKIGYNGWTSPYYKSRMFYQFRWPTISGDQQILNGSQIIAGEFRYLQRHSPQHACNASYGPGVRVRLYNTIDSDTTWPGPGAHSWDPITTSLAVGSESQGCAAKWQVWGITSMLKSERSHSSHKTRTTVTVGIYSADESKKEGWRHYDNNPGPELLIAYNPVALNPELTIANSIAGPPWAVPSSSATLAAKVSLATSGLTCDGSTCLKGRVTVTGPGQSGTPGSWVSTSASSVTVPVSVAGLQDGKAYTVKVEGIETRSARTASKTFTFWSDQNPGTTPTEVAYAMNAGGSWRSSDTSDSLTPLLHARVSLPSGATCLELTECLSPAFTVKDKLTDATMWQGIASPVALNATGQVQVPASAGLVENRQYVVEVVSTKTTNLKKSAVATMTFTAGMTPAETVVDAPASTETLPISATFTNPSPVVKYQWQASCANNASSSGETISPTTSVTVPGCSGLISLQARGVSASGNPGAWSPVSPIAFEG